MDDRQMRLWTLAHSGSHGGKVAAEYIMGMYNGGYFKVDLNNLRMLSKDNLDAMLEEIRIDTRAEKEIHLRYGVSADEIGKLADMYGLKEKKKEREVER